MKATLLNGPVRTMCSIGGLLDIQLQAVGHARNGCRHWKKWSILPLETSCLPLACEVYRNSGTLCHTFNAGKLEYNNNDRDDRCQEPEEELEEVAKLHRV